MRDYEWGTKFTELVLEPNNSQLADRIAQFESILSEQIRNPRHLIEEDEFQAMLEAIESVRVLKVERLAAGAAFRRNEQRAS